MKKILTTISIVVISLSIKTQVFAQVIPPRPDPPQLNGMNLALSKQLECGIWKTYISVDKKIGLGFIGDTTVPLMIMMQDETHFEVWIDSNLDGTTDEYMNDRESLYSKYPSPCDALIKK